MVAASKEIQFIDMFFMPLRQKVHGENFSHFTNYSTGQSELFNQDDGLNSVGICSLGIN
jgi:hypothetical protein